MQISQHDGSKAATVLWPSRRVTTFAELESQANRLAHRFHRDGLRPGDTIAMLMINDEHVHPVMWAARRCGLYYVPINTHLTAAEAGYILRNSAARAVIASEQLRELCVELTEFLPDTRLFVGNDSPAGWDSYPRCVADQPDTPVSDEREGDLLQYSSGTTGRPKGIRRPLKDVHPADAPNPLTLLFDALSLTADSVYLSPAPLYHTAPAMWSLCAQARGATTVIMERFDAEQALEAIEQCRVTHGQFVPTMFVRMLKLPNDIRTRYRLDSLRRLVHAAAPCPVAVKHQMIGWMGPIVDEFYSSSEGAGITFITADDWLDHPGSVGREILGTAHILDGDGHPLPAGEIGDVFFEGGLEFDYLNESEKTAAAHNDRGWVTVGDVGYLDPDGYLYLTDRRHYTIISGGVNIYPQEIEDALISHPAVLDAAVFGVPDDAMGQRVHAVVQPTEPDRADDALAGALTEWLRNQLAHYKCPKTLQFTDRLPRSETGKLHKRTLIDQFARPATPM